MVIYKLWQARFTEAWYQLSEGDQLQLLGQVAQTLKEVGGKELMMCTSAWATDEWAFFGIEEYPDLDAVQRHQQLLSELKWDRYNHSRSTLGTEVALPS